MLALEVSLQQRGIVEELVEIIQIAGRGQKYSTFSKHVSHVTGARGGWSTDCE